MKSSLLIENSVFLPKDYGTLLNEIQKIKSISSKILEGDLGDGIDPFNNELRKYGEVIEATSLNLTTQVSDIFVSDFNKTFKTYTYLALNTKIDYVFPFEEWAKECNKLETLTDDTKIILGLKQVLDFFIDLSNSCNSDLLAESIASYLNSSIDRNAKNSYHLGLLDFVLSKTFPNVSITKLLLCSNQEEYLKVLNGEDFCGNKTDRIIEAAAQLFVQTTEEYNNINDAFDGLLSNELQLNSNVALEKKLNRFKNSDIWQHISNSEVLLTQFCRHFTENAAGMAYFFEISKNLFTVSNSRLYINNIRPGRLALFFKEVIKGDTVNGGYILDLLGANFRNESVRQEFLIERKEIEKIMMFYSLNEGLVSKENINNEKKIKL